MKTRVFLFGLLLSVLPAAAQTLDQSYNPGTTTVSYGVDGTHTRAQTFTVGINGQLVGVGIFTQAVSGDTLYWDLRPTTGGAPTATRSSALASGSLLSSSLPPSASFYYFDLTSFNLTVSSGNVLAFTMWGTTGNTVGGFYGRPDNGYAGGAAFTGATGASTAWSELANTDFKFQTYVIPEPSTYAFAVGVAALGWAGWRRRRRPV